jgi:uncharacterized membrane protein YqaE (UPF0057 family)
MIMKNVRLFFAGLVAVMLVSSCGMMNDGFSGSSIQKRKYTKGFFHSKNKSWSKENDEAKSEKLEEEIFVKDQVIPAEEEKNTPVSIDVKQNQDPIIRKSDRTDQNDNQKAVQKKEESKKVISQEKKTTPVPSKQRRERVPERYLPMKKEAVENRISHQSGSMDDFQLLCVIITIFIPFLGVAIYTNLDVKKTLICLLLTLLFYIPGLIYGLLVVLDKI